MSSEPGRSPRRRPVPMGLLGMLALTLACEGFIKRNELDLISPETWDWGRSGQMAARKAPRAEVLCVGDSLLKLGLVPQVVERVTGKSAYNLAVFAGQPPSSYFLLRRAIESGARPAALVVDFKPHVLQLGLEETRDRWPDLVSLRDCLDLARTAGDAAFFGRTMLARLAPSIKNRYQIRASVLAALQGKSASHRDTLLTVKRNLNRNRGAQVYPRNSGFRGDVNVHDKGLFPDSWACTPLNAAYVRRILRLAGARGIPVFWVLPPVSPAVQARRDRLGLDAAYDRFVRVNQERFPNLVVVDGRHSGYDHTLFIDPTHISRPGACALSTEVATIVNRHLRSPGPVPGSGWVELPPYHEPSVDVPLEDIDQSRLAFSDPKRGPR